MALFPYILSAQACCSTSYNSWHNSCCIMMEKICGHICRPAGMWRILQGKHLAQFLEVAVAQILQSWPCSATMRHIWLHFGVNKLRAWENTERKQDLTLTNTESHSVFMEVQCACGRRLNVDEAPVCICSSSGGEQGGGVILFHLWRDNHSTWVLSKGQGALLIHHYENLLLIWTRLRGEKK